MTDKMRDSPFFGTRVISFTREILSGRSTPTPITDFEKKLLRNEDKIVEINKELDGKLLELLTEARNAVVPATALKLLLYFHTLGRLKDAHKLVYFAARDNVLLTEEDISRLVKELRKDPDASIELWLALMGGEVEDEPPPSSGPALNLPKDFL